MMSTSGSWALLSSSRPIRRIQVCVPKSLQLWERITIRDKSRKGFLHSLHSEIADVVVHNRIRDRLSLHRERAESPLSLEQKRARVRVTPNSLPSWSVRSPEFPKLETRNSSVSSEVR
jgi:hypothetical protein